jgi:hypothetical protein
MKYKTFYAEAEIEVTLSDWDTEELVEELQSRDSLPVEHEDAAFLLSKIYEQRRLGKDYQAELDQLIYIKLGRII